MQITRSFKMPTKDVLAALGAAITHVEDCPDEELTVRFFQDGRAFGFNIHGKGERLIHTYRTEATE